MRGVIRKTFSIFMIMLMIIPSAWIVYAEDSVETLESGSSRDTAAASEDSGAVSETPQNTSVQDTQTSSDVQSAENQSEPALQEPAADAVIPGAEAVTEGGSDTFNDETVADGPGDGEQTESEPEEWTEGPDADSSDGSPDSRGMKSPDAAKARSITIEGTKLDGKSDGTGKGWSYSKDNNTIVLDDFNDKADIVSSGTGMTIVTTGINRIGTLSCDGQIDVIGSGVLLIDKIELAKGCDFNLHSIKEIYGEDGGSAAVFLRQEDGSYLLINGSVTGLIDDEISIPEGTTLVLPENTKLMITGVMCGTTYDEDGNPVYLYDPAHDHNPAWNDDYHPDSEVGYVGKLTVDNLVVNNGASISAAESIAKGMNIVKSLVNNGTISGNEVVIDGDYSGSGAFENALITVNKEQELSITIKDSILSLNGSCEIKDLNNSGNSELYYDKDTTIKNIKMSSGDKLNIFAKDTVGHQNKLKLTGSVSGGNVYFRSGIIDISDQLKLLNGGKFHYSYDGYQSGATVFDYSDSGTVSPGTDGPFFMGPAGIAKIPDQKAVPAMTFTLDEYLFLDGHSRLDESDYNLIDPLDVTDTSANGSISLDDLNKLYKDADTSYEGDPYAYEVFRYVDGKITMTLIGEKFEESVDNDNIILIRIVKTYRLQTQPVGGSIATSTLSQRVGSGTIGGNSNSIMTGTGFKQESSGSGGHDADKTRREDAGGKGRQIRPVITNAAAATGLVLRIDEIFPDGDPDGDEESESYFVLSAYQNAVQISELANPVTVIMDYELPEEFKEKPLYAVFLNEDETVDEKLAAVRAEYDEETGRLSFETSQLGEFIVAALEFEGEEFSAEFYDELEKSEAVRPLLEILKEKEEQARP